MDALKGELESRSQKEGVRGSQLTKVGRDKRQRDGDARQTPIIYSAARSPICTRVLWASFFRARRPAVSLGFTEASRQVPDSGAHTKRLEKAMTEVIKCTGVAATPGVRKL